MQPYAGTNLMNFMNGFDSSKITDMGQRGASLKRKAAAAGQAKLQEAVMAGEGLMGRAAINADLSSQLSQGAINQGWMDTAFGIGNSIIGGLDFGGGGGGAGTSGSFWNAGDPLANPNLNAGASPIGWW